MKTQRNSSKLANFFVRTGRIKRRTVRVQQKFAPIPNGVKGWNILKLRENSERMVEGPECYRTKYTCVFRTFKILFRGVPVTAQ